MGALLKIPMGGMTTYGDIAASIENPRACRAVGTAVGENPVAFLIPCHRVIRATGDIGNYHWGEIRKTALLVGKRLNKNQRNDFKRVNWLPSIIVMRCLVAKKSYC